MERIEIFRAWIMEQTADFGLLEWGISGAVGVCFLLLPFLAGGGSRKRRKRLPAVPMHITFHSFQMAPLGRDALLKIYNTSDQAVLLSASVKRNAEIVVKNALAGHELAPGKAYGIMLEATGRDRMLPDFELVITYMDSRRNVYRQSFFPELQGARRPRRIKRG